MIMILQSSAHATVSDLHDQHDHPILMGVPSRVFMLRAAEDFHATFPISILKLPLKCSLAVHQELGQLLREH